MSALCPSSEIASRILKDDGIILSQNKIREMSNSFNGLSFGERAKLACDQRESLEGKKVLLCVDGGRVNGRFTKKGPLPKNAKGRGFNAEWKEAKLFTLYILKDDGEIDESFAPLVDGTVGDHQQLTKLLKEYLSILEVSKCKNITIVCDGASWHWIRLPKLLKSLKVCKSKIIEVIDYMHAKQNLFEIIENCGEGQSKTQQNKLSKRFQDLLYLGEIEQLEVLIKTHSNSGHKRSNLQKLKSYFLKNKARLNFQKLQNQGHPIGSGHVESAIRRIVNLRIKSPSTFWKLKNAEAMIYIRSQVLFGRWDIVMKNKREMTCNELIKSNLNQN